MPRTSYRLRAFLASLIVSLPLAVGLVVAKPALADLPEPGYGAYTPGTVAVVGRIPDLVAAGFLVDLGNGNIQPGNYDRAKFSVLAIDKWTTYENKRFIDAVMTNKAPVLAASGINANTLWNTLRNEESMYYRELVRLRSGGYPIGQGSITLPNGKVTTLPNAPPQTLVHPDAPAFNSTIVAALNDPAVLRQIGRMGGALLFPMVMQGLVNQLVQRGLISMQTGQMSIEIANCMQSLMYLNSSVRGAVSAATRNVGSVFSIGGGVISGVLACRQELERLGIPLDNTTLGLLHIADCISGLPMALTPIGFVAEVIRCAHDADMAAEYLQGTIIDRGLANLITLMFRSLPDESEYRKVDTELAAWVNAQFPGDLFGVVRVNYLPGVTIQVPRGPDGLVQVSITLLQFKAMMVGQMVTGIVMENGSPTARRIQVNPFPPALVAWCRRHPDECLIDKQGVYRGPTPEQVTEIVKQEGQQIATGGAQPANRLRLDPPSEQSMQMKFPDVQKTVVTSSYYLCTHPVQNIGCAGTAPAARPGQEGPIGSMTTGTVTAQTGSGASASVEMMAGVAVRMRVNGQFVSGTFVVADSSGKWVAMTVSDGNVLVTYVPGNDMVVSKTEAGWESTWTDANGRKWTARSRVYNGSTPPTFEIYEVSTTLVDPETGNVVEVTLRKNPNPFGTPVAQEIISNRATGVEVVKDNLTGTTFKFYTITDPRTEAETRVMEIYQNGRLQSREIISQDEDGNGVPEQQLRGLFMVPNPNGNGQLQQCVGIPTEGNSLRVLCDRGDGVFGDPSDPLGQALPGEDVFCGTYGIGAVYRSVLRPALMGCQTNDIAGQLAMISAKIEEYIKSHLYPQARMPVFDLEELVLDDWARTTPQAQRDAWLRDAGEPATYTVVEDDLRTGEMVTLNGPIGVQSTATAPDNPRACQESLLGLHISLFGESRGGNLDIEGPDVCFTYVSPTQIKFRLGDNVPEDRYFIGVWSDAAFDFVNPRHTEPVMITTDPTAPRVTASALTYLAGQTPAYTITKAEPNKPICWTSTKDGVVRENNVCYGQSTDANGNWSGPGPGALQAADAGLWVRRAKVAGRTSATGTSAQFRVAAQCEYTWTAWTEFTDGTKILGCKATLRFTGGNAIVEDEYGITRWSSNTPHSPPGKLVFQGGGYDGNLVVYNASQQPLWAAYREATGGSLRLQSDGKLGVFNALGQPVWTSTDGGSLDAPVTIAVNKPSQQVGEQPTYTVTGAAFQPVRLKSWLFGTQRDYGIFVSGYTDSTGRWTGPGPQAWSNLDTGDWIFEATVNGRSARTSFNVSFGPPPNPAATLSVGPGKCLDLPGWTVEPGARPQQWGCHGGTNQQWYLERVTTNTYLIKSVHSGLCLDVWGASTADGAEITQWPCHGGANQQWYMTGPYQTGGTVKLVAVHSGKCLDGPGWTDGAIVHQWTCTYGNGNQDWRIGAAGPGKAPACGYTFTGPKLFVPGEHYVGCNGTLWMQGDGNLVIYSPSGRALWASGTAGYPGSYAIYEGGSLTIYHPEAGGPRWLWSTGTWLGGEGRLEFQGDGNFVVYASWGMALWATNTFGDPPPPPPPPPNDPPPPPPPNDPPPCGNPTLCDI